MTIDLAARCAYVAFLKSLPAGYRPALPPEWEKLPDVLKQAWKAAAAAARDEN